MSRMINTFGVALALGTAMTLTACGGEEPGPEEKMEDGVGGKADVIGGQFCGGIGGLQCPEGLKCQLEGTYPDAGGRCVPTNYCDTPQDCYDSDLIRPMCLGQWECRSHVCHWQCGVPDLFKCGPFPGGECAAGQVCDIQSCGLGAAGTCVTQPTPDQCVELMYLPAQPVCGCDGQTYGNDCERLAAGVPLDHQGACGGPTCGAGPACPEGSKCVSGMCVDAFYCETEADCYAADPIHPMCLGQWECQSNSCAWECTN